MKLVTVNDIIIGKVYEAKRPSLVGNIFTPFVNDRQIRWISDDRLLVQYDSPTVKNGRNYPTITIEKFLKWVGRDVTTEMPEGNWRTSFK